MAKKKTASESIPTSSRAVPAEAKPKAVSRPKKSSSKAATREMIAKRAYELYVARGRVDGYAEQDWRQAELELNGGR